jgi:hypothetical protein
MRTLVLALAALTVGGCTWLGPAEGTGSEPVPEDDSRAAIYETVVRQLVTEDSPPGSKRLERIYIVDGPVHGVANPRRFGRKPREPFPEGLRSALRSSLDDLASVTFPRSMQSLFARTEPGRSVVVVLGPVIRGDRRVWVGASLWPGVLGARWMRYGLRREGETWAVARSEMVAIS